MPKLKTHKGASKRFKKTGTGKVVRNHAFARHILTSKSRKRKRKLHKSRVGGSRRPARIAAYDPLLGDDRVWTERVARARSTANMNA